VLDRVLVAALLVAVGLFAMASDASGYGGGVVQSMNWYLDSDMDISE